MRDVVIVSAARTPIGSFGGALKSVPTRTLGAIAVKEAIKRAGIKAEDIDEVVLGCVLQGALGQNVARQIAMDAGIPKEVPAMTLNKVCGSGLRAISLAAQMIKAGDADIVVAGGAENMSMAAYAVPSARWGARMNNAQMVDMMVNDGLWDAFNGYHMGITAENVAEQWGITREELDEFSVISQNRAEEAIKAGKFKDEIVPVEIPQRKGDPIIFDTDEHPKFGSTMEKVGKLKPAFKKDGIVTAANASGINDAGAAVIVMSKEKAEAAIKAGKFKDEIVPVEIPQKKGDPIIFDTDEFPKFGTTMEKVAKLKPAFKKDGIVTAANASGINDAGAAVVVMSKEKADELGIKPLCTIKSYASAGVDPSIMGVGPIPASQKALAKAGLTIEDIDLV